VAFYAGRETQYVIGANSVTVGPDGDDTLLGIERLKFLSPSDVSDLDNNGTGDLVYQNQTNGNINVRLQNPLANQANITGVGAAWRAVGTGKFTIDTNRNDSILVQNNTTQDLRVITAITGASVLGVNTFAFGIQPGAGWTAIDTGDFNGDATSDVLLQNGGNAMILFTGGTAGSVTSQVTFAAPAGYTAISGGDFNGDGFSDILWQNAGTKDVKVTLMDGATTLDTGTFSPGPGFTAIGTGDFNNDGNSDILFSNGANTATIWYMNGTSFLSSSGPIVGPGAGFNVVGAEDVISTPASAGYSDLLWRDDVNGLTRVTAMGAGGPGAISNLSSPAATFGLIASTGGG
jgi:hypothetical protein